MAQEIVLLPGKRTPFGAFGGAFKDISANDLGVHAAKAALKAANVDPKEIDHVIFGNVAQTSEDAPYLARHIGLKSGVPIAVPAYTVNRLCGSGFQAIVNSAEEILCGEAFMVLAGGTENMSQSPYVVKNARWGIRLGHGELQDYLWAALTDKYTGLSMALSTEDLATVKGISRQASDEYALRSQMTYQEAFKKGIFKEEISGVDVRLRGQDKRIENDEHPKPQTTLKALSDLKPYFKADGVVTAGSASGITDGAAACVVTSMDQAKKRGLKPIGKLLGWGVAGCEPKHMGIGPALAIPKALKKAGLSLKDIDLIEINEAFSAQYLAVEKELGLDRNKVNVNGGAISIGHPLGASGARISNHLLYELRRRGKKYGVGSACIGGGMGIALVFESIS